MTRRKVKKLFNITSIEFPCAMVCCLLASGLLCVVVRPHPYHDAHDEVESYDDPPGLKESEDEQQYEGRGCEDVFHLVAFPTPLLEFQGEHRQLANQ